MLKIHGNIFLQVVLKSKDDQATVIGAGVTLHEALAAAEQLRKGDYLRVWFLVFFFYFYHLTREEINTTQPNCSPVVLVNSN